MSRGRQTFKQGDVTKAVRGAMNAGISLRRVEIDREGKIVLIPDVAVSSVGTRNEWDDVQ
jgi:hypothetical protein